MLKLFGIPSMLGALALAALYYFTGDLAAVAAAVSLIFLELGLSMDNAVVQADKVKSMNPFWKTVFFWVGIPVAVVGMRFAFPLGLVSSIEGISFLDAYHLAVQSPDKFAASLLSAHATIASFGGCFLLLTAIQFYGGDEREYTWIPGVEHILSSIYVVRGLEFVAVLAAILISYQDSHELSVVFGGLAGCILFVVMSALKQAMEHLDSSLGNATNALLKVLQGGLAGFIYLELLDSAFSVDSVLGALAVSHNVWVVAIGLGVGAMFVRQLTLWMVETGATAEFKYLPNGAFFSILCLALYSFVSINPAYELPDWAVALTSVGFIVASLITSKLSKSESTVAVAAEVC
jgi:hypothetical protein